MWRKIWKFFLKKRQCRVPFPCFHHLIPVRVKVIGETVHMLQLLPENYNHRYLTWKRQRQEIIYEPKIWFWYNFHKTYSRSVEVYIRSKSAGVVGGFSGVLYPLSRRCTKVDRCKGTCSSWICFIRIFTGKELGTSKLSSPLLASGAREAEMRINSRIYEYEHTIVLCNLKSRG